MIPAAVRHPSLRYINNQFYLADAVNNVLLYIPLGIALGGSSLWRAFLYGLGLSTLAETLQLGYIDRSPSFVDIANNTIGAVVGYLIARIFLSRHANGPRLIALPRLIAVAAVPIAILGTLALLHNRPASDFSNWNPQYQLAVGNELNGNRPWTGTISGLAIYPVAMPAREVEVLARQGKVYPAEAGQSPIAGPFEAADLSTRFGQPLLSPEQQRSFFDALTSANQLTILVEMQTADLEQSGPARIVTNSHDAWGRNFTLGQNRSGLTFRLRTPATGGNGVDPALYTGPVLEANRTMQVAAVYNGRFSSLYVDGRLEAQTDLGARRPRLPKRVLMSMREALPLREIELVAAEILLSGLLAIGVFGMVGVPRRRSVRYLLGAVAGAMIAAILCTFAVSQPWLALGITLESVAAGLVIAASVVPENAKP
jgi:hypothetical protein